MLTKLVIVAVLLSPFSTLADEPISESVQPSPATQQRGLWPSEKLMGLLLQRWADEIGYEYEMDAAQRDKVRKTVVDRWLPFFEENSPALAPLFNEFLEMRLEIEPPDKKRVENWARRAMPMFEQVRKQIDGGVAEFREILTPVQRAKFELQVLELGVGMRVSETWLKRMKEGDFDVSEIRDLWQTRRAQRRRLRAERRRQREEAGKKVEIKTDQGEVDQIARELGRWEKYVDEFILVYNLDEGQRSAVLSCLSELRQRATAHRDIRREEVAKLEQRILSFTGKDADLAVLKKQLTELYGPIDAMFEELKDRIEQIPTAQQRERFSRENDRDGAEQKGEGGRMKDEANRDHEGAGDSNSGTKERRGHE